MNRPRLAIVSAASLVVLSALVAVAKNSPRQQTVSAPAQTLAAGPAAVQKGNDE